ncbi:hypothetical protein [Vibrio mediterranei]|uniref:hypothetical protein n=1 Tax=Vibrio mediterranei TaxID=689 RepID=UPI00148D3D6B|nr:hypothetical protein [Vibrio mediterranei]NOH31749.1 hypothetical protein [Vibrio mediterranei]
MITFLRILFASLLSISISVHAADTDSASETSRKLADPTSDIWALFTAFEATNFKGDAIEGSEWGGSMIIEPVMPITLTPKLKLLTRPALPIFFGAPVPNEQTYMSGSNSYRDIDHKTGLGDLQLPLMFSPITGNKFTWGLGPSFILPTHTDDALGDDVWQAGVAALGVYKPDKTLTVGALSQYWWSIDDNNKEEEKSHAQIVVFGWKELGGGKSVGFGPTITYDAKREGTKWNVPLGVNYAWMSKIGGKIPVKYQIGADVSVIKNDTYDPDFVLKLNVIPVVPSLF